MADIAGLDLDGLKTVLGWAGDEGWNPGLDDAEAFLAADPQGFFGLSAQGRLAAAVSVVRHSETYAFLGLYICRPALRGQGHGLAVWTAAMAHAGDRTVGLAGVPAQQANYARSGFRMAGLIQRYTGALPPGAAGDLEPPGTGVPALVALQEGIMGSAAPAYLRAWFTDTATRQTRLVRRAGQIAGFGTIRECQRGFKIGPFAARDAETARTLLSGLAAVAGSGEAPVSVDVDPRAPALAELLRAAGLRPDFETGLMYRGTPPGGAPWPFTGSGTLELG